MASVVESSANSVPAAQLALLRDKLLEQQEPDEEANAATSRPNGLHAPNAPPLDDSDDVSGLAPATVPESDNAYVYQTPHSSPRAVLHPPRMNVSKSASEVEMEGMVHQSPSQEAFVTMTRASSFHGYPGGDTQLMESQVYRAFDASTRKATLVTPVKATEEYSYNTCGTEKTPRTLVDGDTQYINVVNALTSPGAQSTTAFDKDDFEPTQIQADSDPNPTTASPVPQTPAIAGKKRSHSGEILTSVTTAPKTLALSQLFGGNQDRPIFSATQAFNQTQAPSSPVPDGPRSDPAFTRPSPNHINRLATSSPPLPSFSSPYEIVKASTAGEPRDNYMRMCESQERRASLRLKAGLDTEPDVDDALLGDGEEEMDNTLRQATRKRLHRAKSDQALLALSKFGAPSRRGSRNTPRPRTAPIIDLVTPAITKAKEVYDMTKLDDDESSQDSEDEALPEDEALENADLDNDQYDELAQTVIRSQGSAPESEHGDAPMDEADDDGEATEDYGNDVNTVPESTSIDANETVGIGQVRTQNSTVADSQPLRQEHRQTVGREQSVQPPSSMSLLVPGSQYAGKTSQDQAQLAKQSWTLPQQRTSSSASQLQHRVTSSPPLSVVEEGESARVAAATANDRSMAPQEIPESDIPMSDAVQAGCSRPVSAHGRVQADSNNLAIFSTAPTHVSQPAPLSRGQSSLASPVKVLASQQSQLGSQSPITAAGVRRLADIAAMQSPKASNETQVSVVAIMNGIMDADDENFLQAVSSPPDDRPLKRRRLTRRTGAGDEVIEAGTLSTMQTTVVEDNRGSDAETFKDVDMEEVGEDDVPSPKPLRESPSKANEMNRKTTTNGTEPDRTDAKTVTRPLSAIKRMSKKHPNLEPRIDNDANNGTSESVREREQAGANTASQLISERSVTRGRIGSSKAGAKTSAKANAGKKPNRDKTVQKAAAVEADLGNENPSDLQTVRGDDELHRVVAPHRIFTLFKGTHNNFYTATWLHALPDGLNHRVKFDDGTKTSIELQHIRRLELRVGDQVKVNVDGMRGKNWIITSLPHPVQDGTADIDIFGRARLQVQPKSSRTSLPTSTAALEETGESVEVAMSDVYLTHTMWPHFNDRIFNPPSTAKLITSRAATPSSTAHTPTVETPNSRIRRSLGGAAKGNNVRSSYVRDDGAMLADGAASIGLFSGMAFAITYVSNEDDKHKVMRAIKGQGGLILDKGFDELFDDPDAIDGPAESPGRKKSKDAHPGPAETSGLNLQPQYEGLGFVALIADRHSRRAKYMQALALGIPTLASRWILDSLDVSRNASLTSAEPTPLPWAKYLLPTGESSYLGGAVRSRIMAEYATSSANLSDTLKRRSLLLNADGVLIVAPKKGKGPSERSKTYAFLTLALGAGAVKRVADLQEAKTMTNETPGTWKWVYVDGSVADASSIIHGKRGAGGKKRKRDDEATKVDGDAMFVGNGSVNVVNDEFVVQSLILGALID